MGAAKLTAASVSVGVIAKDDASEGGMGIVIKALWFVRSNGAFDRVSGTSLMKLRNSVLSKIGRVPLTSGNCRLLRVGLSTRVLNICLCGELSVWTQAMRR